MGVRGWDDRRWGGWGAARSALAAVALGVLAVGVRAGRARWYWARGVVRAVGAGRPGAVHAGGDGGRVEGGGRRWRWWCKGWPAMKSRGEGSGDGFLRREGEKKKNKC
ncbi:hypothetical protein ACOSP7_007497 [Xanthoceras sorbifolium]